MSNSATLLFLSNLMAKQKQQSRRTKGQRRGGTGRGGGREGAQIDNEKCRRRKFIQLRTDKYAYL
jgi:hypothetical protein